MTQQLSHWGLFYLHDNGDNGLITIILATRLLMEKWEHTKKRGGAGTYLLKARSDFLLNSLRSALREAVEKRKGRLVKLPISYTHPADHTAAVGAEFCFLCGNMRRICGGEEGYPQRPSGCSRAPQTGRPGGEVLQLVSPWTPHAETESAPPPAEHTFTRQLPSHITSHTFGC